MLGFLFRGLTTPTAGARLFDAVTREARRRHWYLEGEVPDTLDGRFAMLVTISALTIARLEQLGDAGTAESAALTERFVEAMEAEHRELGLGDPTLGKTVRKLVGSLGRRAELWRSEAEWRQRARESVYKGEPNGAALDHVTASLKQFWSRLENADAAALMDGRIE